jgi:hypothetical protein
VIRVATVHWRDPRWIDVQLRYLERHLPQPYLVYTDLEGIDKAEHGPKFHHVADLAATKSFENGIFSHTEKLNALAQTIAAEADPRDVVLFLDGDAFPIAPVAPFLEEKLGSYALAAVRRDENLDDIQPHPAFAATTVRFWQEIGGDWNPGYEWRNAAGKAVTDAGGNLFGILREREIDWYPLQRTNRRNLRPLWFAVYDDLVYHHGAGFRGGLCRRDREAIGRVPEPPPDPPPGAGARDRLLWELRARKWYWVDKRPIVKRERETLQRNKELSERIYSELQSDPSFWLSV